MKSHFTVSRAVVAACASAAALSHAAGITIAYDDPGQPAYDDGWSPGDNGGFGFGPWNMDGTYTSPIQHAMDFTSPHDQIRVPAVNGGPDRAWTIFNPDAPDPEGGSTGTDISQAGRAITGGLQVGDTVSLIIDNPQDRRFFRGYTVRFNTGSGNTVYAGTPQSRMAVGTFEYFTNGKWFATGTGGDPTLFDIDTNSGMQIDLTLDTANTFTLTMTRLDAPSLFYSKSGTLDGPAGSTIDWIEFETYNTDSDFYPAPNPFPNETDFYISTMLIDSRIPAPAGIAVLAIGGVGLARRRR